ncbi:hypothetical protein ACFFGR_09425 [Arthrobacter liuii]|uniref:Helix-turn-helix DNA binding domain protein n=1 Tax=Arthrobacter liuii TaxID=1476996 RepID=A0ABQ2APV7_9MICC|nr:hypothetical protein [Arthrobacter liuii]GGH93898.1 hypothetical protein GCM10007170_15840 [Arthrobacter liuii]
MRKSPATQAELNRSAELFADGASQTEVHRTTGLARETLRKNFPGQGWTYREAGSIGFLTRKTNHAIRRTA